MELSGIILDYTTPRAYWDTPDPVEGTPPVCMSQNSISADRLEVEQGVGLALFAGGLLQSDLRDHAGDRRQGAQ